MLYGCNSKSWGDTSAFYPHQRGLINFETYQNRGHKTQVRGKEIVSPQDNGVQSIEYYHNPNSDQNRSPRTLQKAKAIVETSQFLVSERIPKIEHLLRAEDPSEELERTDITGKPLIDYSLFVKIGGKQSTVRR